MRALFAAPTVGQMGVALAQHQANQARPEEVERLLATLEAMSEDQAKERLTGKISELGTDAREPY